MIGLMAEAGKYTVAADSEFRREFCQTMRALGEDVVVLRNENKALYVMLLAISESITGNGSLPQEFRNSVAQVVASATAVFGGEKGRDRYLDYVSGGEHSIRKAALEEGLTPEAVNAILEAHRKDPIEG